MRHRSLMALMLCLAIVSPACRKKEPGPAAETPNSPRAAAAGLVDDKALVDGRLLTVAHSQWDLGQTSDLFDADPATFARTEKASPAVVEIRFPEPRPLKGVRLKLGGEDFRVTATVKPAGGGAPKTYTKEVLQSGFDPEIELDFGSDSTPVESVRIEVFALRSADGHIHIRTLQLR